MFKSLSIGNIFLWNYKILSDLRDRYISAHNYFLNIIRLSANDKNDKK